MVTSRPFSIAIALCTAAALFASEPTETRIFDPTFRTLKVQTDDAFMMPPVIRLDSNDSLTFSFDELGDDNSWLEYRLVHCNADWQPSTLVDSEFLDGFNGDRIEDFGFSSNTFVHYVNYHITIPNEHTRILHSGNYLLQVYDPDESDTVLLQARFMVSENALAIDGASSSRTDRGHYGEYQQLEFSVDTDGFGMSNPYSDFVVEIRQNGRNDTARVLRSPMSVQGDKLVYAHSPLLIFPASNEYRRFESVSTQFLGMNVDAQHYEGSNYHVDLKPDYPRSDSEYSYDRTQHGRFLVREYNATDSDLAADYLTVKFSLVSDPLPLPVYVDGEFSHGEYSKRNQMTYDAQAGRYVAEIPLKQGAYNYQYVTVDPATGVGSTSAIEGDKYETDNEYSVAVYFRPPGARADRLVGFTLLNNL